MKVFGGKKKGHAKKYMNLPSVCLIPDRATGEETNIIILELVQNHSILFAYIPACSLLHSFVRIQNSLQELRHQRLQIQIVTQLLRLVHDPMRIPG